ncbi:hypothetical protein AMAG_07897 [Allomyces macrogynus ATCC 38327]|uniref:Uncharacterized protein n=1 Tax=Allomyces macrogynus (strain ATCC 38327) TaxID=578462 RepID=A0A0L0SJQ1_ALLM3|nr:hypothetical protein AMAG_07897 [Allomyces macrogynus ATCC 38327]|eukprot:KNE62707.1 hypothetical protein AMAG_07897 [Allomyces macrogynus ATCC 38327]
MDTPVTLRSDDVRSECAKALRGAVVDDAVGDADAAACVVRIDNDRWSGVPLVLEAHAGDDVGTEIRVLLAAVGGAHDFLRNRRRETSWWSGVVGARRGTRGVPRRA